MELSIAFQTGKHTNACPYSKHDARVAALIAELAALDDDYDGDVLDTPLASAHTLKKKLPKLRACKLLHYFKSEQPKTLPSDAEFDALKDTYTPLIEEIMEGTKCQACCKNLTALLTGPTVAFEIMRGDLDVSLRTQDIGAENQAFLDALDAELELLSAQIVYVESRAKDLYFGDMLETHQPDDSVELSP